MEVEELLHQRVSRHAAGGVGGLFVEAGGVAVADDLDSLIYFPLDEANADIDLGDVLSSGDEFVSSMSMETFSAFFDSPLQNMQLLARFDNIGKYIKNYYANFDPEMSTFYETGLTYWYLSRDPIVDDVFLTPEQLAKERYGLWCNLRNVTDFDMSDILSGAATLVLRPPPGIEVYTTNSDELFSNDNPLSTEGDHWESVYFDSVDFGFDGGLSVRAPSTSGYPESFSAWLTGETPEGTWTLELDGVEIAWFDLTSACETDVNGNFTVFVPMPMFDFNDEGVLTAVEVKFVYFDRELQAYVELPDYGVLASFIDLFGCGMRDYDQSAGSNGFYEENIVWDDSVVVTQGRIRVTEFEYDWCSPENPAPGAFTIDEFGAQFQYGAAHFSFGLRTDGGS